MAKSSKQDNRIRRKASIRKHVSGTTLKPRVFVFKSNRYLHFGVADDSKGLVVLGGRANRTVQDASLMGGKLAESMKKKKIETAVFDRSGYKYHGVVAKFVESLREKGIKI